MMMMKWCPTVVWIVGWLIIAIDADNSTVQPRIIVIGAGAAGIAAASYLYQHRITNLTILEGSLRRGGRIRTAPFAGGVVELGAQWCHGEQDNIVYQMASVYPGLLQSSVVMEESVMVQSNGARVPAEVAEQLMMLGGSIIDSEERSSVTGSLGDFFTNQYWHKLRSDPAYSAVSRDLAQQFLVHFHNYQRGYNAYETWHEVAANETDSYVESAGNQGLAWMGEKGYSTILDIISGHYGNSINTTLSPVPLDQLIVYDKFVSNIQWQGTPNGTVHVTTDDGSLYEADHVIVTVSLGVLKENHRTMFSPALPTVNQRAIEGLHFGTVNKIILLFDAPIPEDFPSVVQLLWYDSDLQALRNSNHAWTEAIAFFYRVDNQPNALTAWVNGGQAELLSEVTAKEGVLHLLSIFAKNYQLGNVTSIRRSNWSSDRLFRGSYSSRSLTTEQLKTGAKDLATPLTNDAGKPVVQFAGEATSRKRFSTVHGAVESGQREAKRLLQYFS